MWVYSPQSSDQDNIAGSATTNMGRLTVVNIGLLIILIHLARSTIANKCQESYSCTKVRYRRNSYKVSCGAFGWDRCTRYRSVAYNYQETCQREACCRGYTGPTCKPLCFGVQNCPNAGTCVNPDHCVCPTGYSSPRCADINECATNNGGCEHKCINTIGSFRCSCRTGFFPGNNGKSCLNINECATNNGGCETGCVDLPGSYKCTCNQGYNLTPNNKTCYEINECEAGTSGCAQICKNTPGSFTCSCGTGYVAKGTACEDIDECLSGTDNCSQVCNNKPGSYQCSCNEGFQLYSDESSCSDVNECQFINGGCQHECTNTVGSFTCACNGDTALALDGFSCIGETSQNSSVFKRGKLARKLLPRGCHDIVLTSCPDGNDIEIHLSSTSQWYTSLADAAIRYSPGIIFAEVNDLFLPVSLSGVTVRLQEDNFSLSVGVAELSPYDGNPVGTTRSEDCLSLDFTPADVFEFISANSFVRTIFDRIVAVLPDFIQLTGMDSSILEVADLKTDFVHGIHMDMIPSCEGAQVIYNHIYSVFRFDTDFELSIYGNTINIPKPLGNKQFCLIIDISHNNGGTLFLMVPEGSRDLLMDFEFFRKLRDTKGLSILPRGIGISLVKGVNVKGFDTQLQLWNGDHFFTYTTFARSDVWLGGDIHFINDMFDITAEVDSFLSVPNPGQILTGVFIEEFNVLVHATEVPHVYIKFELFNTDYTVQLTDLVKTSVDVYLSIGGTDERKWCGDGSLTDIANPPGAFYSTIITVNPFENIPILGDWVLKASTRLNGYFTTDTLQALSPNNTISIMDDILKFNETLDRLGTFLKNLQQNIKMSFLNATINLVDNINIVIEETKTILTLHLADLLQGNVGNLSNLLRQLWAKYVKIKNAIRDFIDNIEFIISDIKEVITKYLEEELEILRKNVDNALQKLSNQVVSAEENYSAFGVKFAINVKLFGLDLGELDVELSISNDIVARCSRFSDVYDLLKGEKAIRFLARYFREQRMGFFLKAEADAGIRGAFGMESHNLLVQFNGYIEILGFSTTADVFLSRNGLQVYVEGNVWNIFLAQIEMTATLGDEWDKLTYTLKGRFVARRQIQSQENSYQSSFMDALTESIRQVADGAEGRLSQAQECLSKAQDGLTKAQDWLQNKKDDVRKANGAFDAAVAKLDSANKKLEAAKGSFEEALTKLSAAQRKVDNLCRIRSCRTICIAGMKCKTCYKKVWGGRIPYPCCEWTSCLNRVPDPTCIAANSVCRKIRDLAYIALEAAKLFVRAPMQALDLAKASVPVAQVIVDESRIILDVAIAAIEIAKGELELAKDVLEAERIALDAVKYAIRGALRVLEFVIQDGVKSVIDVRNCGFEVQISTTNLQVFEVSCEVNAFKLGWKTVRMRIDFRNAVQTIWRAAKAAIDNIVSELKINLDRKKREITFETSMKMHRLLRQTRQTKESPTEADIDDIIDVINQTTGMSTNISDTYESRVKWFGDKCESITRVQRFLVESFNALHDIANESKSSMEIPATLTEEAVSFDFDEIMRSITLESAEISVEYGEGVYMLKREDMEATLLDAKKTISDDPVAKEVMDAKKAADEIIKEEITTVDMISIIDHWKVAMLNHTTNYFEDDECCGFEDCLFYAITNLYELYDDENELPNIRTIKELVSDLETKALAVIQSDVKNARDTFELAESVYSTILALERLNMFCSEAPRFTTSFRNSTVLLGSHVRIDCSTDAKPTATIWWFNDGIWLPEQTRDILSIISATEEDAGAYLCVAGNIVANITSPEMTLSVFEPEDLCLAQGNMTFVTNDEYCRTFYRCNETGAAQPMCCRSGRRYEETEGMCVATDEIECIQEICPNGYDEECRLVAGPGEPTVYRDLDAPGSPEMHCAPGTFFNPESCGCGGVGNGNDCDLRHVDGAPNKFMSGSTEMTCGPETIFSLDECTCVSPPNLNDCDLRHVDGAPNKFMLGSTEMTCGSGTIFSLDECTCVSPPNLNGCWYVAVPGHPELLFNVIAGVTVSCPVGTVFNPSICVCDFPRNGRK